MAARPCRQSTQALRFNRDRVWGHLWTFLVLHDGFLWRHLPAHAGLGDSIGLNSEIGHDGTCPGGCEGQRVLPQLHPTSGLFPGLACRPHSPVSYAPTS